ncbi:MAG: MFS transporter [Planctomycetota bacterium]
MQRPTVDLEYEQQPARVKLDKRAMATLFAVTLSGHIGFGIIIPQLPLFAERYWDSGFGVGLLFSVYSICQLIASPLLGALSDKIGRRPVLIVSQLGSCAGYVLLGWALLTEWSVPIYGYWVIFLSRIIDGFTAGNVGAAQAYIADVSRGDPGARSRALGLIGASFGIGFVIGPALGGLLSQWVAVSAPAFAAAGFTFGSAILAAAVLREPAKHVDSDNSLSFKSVTRVLSDRSTGPLIGAWFTAMLAFVMVEPVASLLLADERAFGFSEAQVGYFFGLVGLVIVLIQGGLIGRLVDAFGEWNLIIAGPAIVILGLLAYTGTTALPVLWLLGVAGVCGATGRSIHTVASAGLLSRYADDARQGTAYGVYNGAASLARVIGPLIAGAAFDLAMFAPFVIAIAVMVVALAWLLILRTRMRSLPEPATPEPVAA